MNQKNGNEQINSSREYINHSIGKYSMLGRSKSKLWNSKHRFRSI